MARCGVCFRNCDIKEGGTGFCGARSCSGGKVFPSAYGVITAAQLDPIEKKPLRRFRPGSMIFSIGSRGCNLRCPFCQNSDISWSEQALSPDMPAEKLTPEEVVSIAGRLRERGNIGIAFTYNEPLICYEFVRDTAKLAHSEGMANVIVTNGTAGLHVLDEISPYIDAMNIDLKGFTDGYYKDLLSGNRKQVMGFISEAVKRCHVELTTLIIPGENDSEEQMREMSAWIAGLRADGRDIPLHVSRFFPRFHMTDRAATDPAVVYRLADVARENLRYVYTGNC